MNQFGKFAEMDIGRTCHKHLVDVKNGRETRRALVVYNFIKVSPAYWKQKPKTKEIFKKKKSSPSLHPLVLKGSTVQ